jgi:spore maturation protein CgeB
MAGGPVWGTEYVGVLALAKIGLGLLSKYYPDQFTTRSFEIPGAGAMLLAERTPDHLEIFEEGKDADFFSSPAELIDKTQFYLTHHKQRTAVAAAGRSKVLHNYHWRDVLRPALGFIEKGRAS